MNQKMLSRSVVASLLHLLRQGYFHSTTTKSIIILITIYSTGIVAQTTDNDSGAKHRRWTLSAYLGFAAGGPAQDIEELMIAGGFNENSGRFGFASGRKDHPFSVTGINNESGAPWMLGIHYVLRWPFAVGVIFSQTPIGATFGFRAEPPNNLPIDLDINYSVTLLAPVLTIQASDIVRFGIGPAIYYPKTGTSSFETLNQSKISSQVGFLIDFGLSFPPKTRFFGELKVQYRSTGQVQIGPFKKETLGFSSTLPAMEVSYSHWFIGIGFGVSY